MFRGVIAAVVALLAAGCTTATAERRLLQSSVARVLAEVDPHRRVAILAYDNDVARVRDLVGRGREVIAVTKFDREHPGEAVPANLLIQSAEILPSGAVLVKVHQQAVSHPPPDVLFCGLMVEYTVTNVRGRWIVDRREGSLC